MLETHEYVKITSLMTITLHTKTTLKHLIHLQLQEDSMELDHSGLHKT
jgi:hypothetical protein